MRKLFSIELNLQPDDIRDSSLDCLYCKSINFSQFRALEQQLILLFYKEGTRSVYFFLADRMDGACHKLR